MSDIWTVFAIVGVIVVLFIWDRLPVIAVCMIAALSLWATGILTLNQSMAGFGDPAIIFVASLFVVSAGLEATGVTAWAGQILIRQAGDSRPRLIVLMMGVAGLLSGLISVNGAVASLLPVVIVMAIRLGQPPSQLLMPLVFAAHAGSQILLTGSPVNVLVSEASLDAGGGGFGYLEFALVGFPLIAGSILIVVLFGRWLLPSRTSATLPPDLSRHAMTLIEQYRLASDVHQLRVREESPLVGVPRQEFDLSGRDGLTLVTLKEADGRSARRDAIRPGDVVVVRGQAEAAAALAGDFRLSFSEEDAPDLERTLFNRQSGLAEIQIPPRSKLVGERFFPGMVTRGGDLIVLAVQRHGEDLDPSLPLAVGDTLLLQGTWAALEKRLKPAEVLMVNSPDLVRRQALPMGPGARNMLAILGAMVVLLATGLVPPAIAGVLAAGAVLLSGIQSVDQVYRAINWTTVILMGAMMPLSTAMQQTGAADLLATGLVDMIGESSPHLLLVGLFVLSAVMGQIISNTATALIVIPIAVVAAAQMGVSPQPILMAVCLASAAAFLTPVATPTNLMVMDPGAYRFGDYWKLGLPLMIWFFLIAVFLVPVLWSF
ncbi:anion permease [Cereibacter sphaeroides]|uniref:SLC13 family permease n=1 Tax=Cereibacter sphaeroides TaxID=1063 RepID=UPI001F24B405|nr:SLC13 family permease [Cereibacter sphaeroides]MCE6960612.1 anion permease [Cereibacter sphaeroides]MCE6970121.1 anion permease [Cereibacter sphaeroides]MCE6971434.1 anion permease [Cereibacter sphaeroides]